MSDRIVVLDLEQGAVVEDDASGQTIVLVGENTSAAAQSAQRAEQALTGAEEIRDEFETLAETAITDLNAAGAVQLGLVTAQAGIATDAAAAAVTTLASINDLSEIVEFIGMAPRKLANVTIAGSWYQNASGHWVQTTSANQLKPLFENGRQTGFTWAAARGPVNSAPIHNTVPTSGQPGFATQSGGTGTLTFAYAGQHSAPDRYGTTGKGLLVTVNSGNTRLVAFDGQAMAFTAGQFAFVGCTFSINAGTVPEGTVMLVVFPKQISGTMPGGQITATMGADGKWVFSAPNTVRRWGGEFLGTINGRDRYWAWWEQRCAADCSIAPQTRMPNSTISGLQILIEECWVERTNGRHRPRPTPVLAHNVTLAQEGLVVGTSGERFNALFHRQCVGVRGAPGNLVGPPNAFWAGPATLGEDRIRIWPSRFSDNAPVLLPSGNNKLPFSPFGTNDPVSLLYHGHFDVQVDERDGIATGTGRSGTTFDLRAAFGRENPASLERIVTSQTFVTSITFEGVLMMTSDTATSDLHAMGQAIIWTTPAYDIRASATVNFGDWVAFGSHSGHHGRWNFAMPADTGTDAGRRDDGTYDLKLAKCPFYGIPQVLVNDGGTVTFDQVLNYQIGNGLRFATSSSTNLTLTPANANAAIYSYRTYNDGFNLGRGRYSFPTPWLYVFEPSTHIDMDLYHCPPGREIEVDTGSGWTALSASSYTQTTLPRNRWFERWGNYTVGTDTLTYVPNPDQRCRMPDFTLKNIGGVPDVPGFQFHASLVPDRGQVATYLPSNSVWVSWGAGTPEKPHIRIVRGDGRWVSGSPPTWNSTPPGGGTENRPVGTQSGMHADGTQWNFDHLEDCVYRGVIINPLGQGYMIQGQETSPARSTIKKLRPDGVLVFCGALNGILTQGDNTTGTDVQFAKSSVLICDTGFRFINDSLGEPGRYHVLGVGAATFDPATTTVIRRTVATTGVGAAGDGVQLAAWSGQPIVSVTGRPRRIVGTNLSTTNTPASALLDGNGNVIEPTFRQVVRDPSVLTATGYADADKDILANFRLSEAGQQYLGWDGNALLDQGLRVRTGWRSAVIPYIEMKGRDWIYGGAKATIPNSTAVGTEVVLYDVNGNIAQFPNHYIDELTGDGFGRDGFFEFRSTGRCFVRRALTGQNRGFIITLTPFDPSARTVNIYIDVTT